MNLFNDDPAFSFEVNALRSIRHTGELEDKDTGKLREYDSMVVQCTWTDCAGLPAVCLAKPVADYKPDLSRIRGNVRFAVISAKSAGGQLVVRFSGWEPVK